MSRGDVDFSKLLRIVWSTFAFSLAMTSLDFVFANDGAAVIYSQDSGGAMERAPMEGAGSGACKRLIENSNKKFPVEYPESIDGLLRNILYGVKSRILADKTLYAKDGFGNLIGSVSVQYYGLELTKGARVSFSRTKGDRELLGLPEPDKRSFIDEISESYSGGAGVTNSGICFGTFLINFSENSFSFKTVERVFGMNWKKIEPQAPPSSGFRASTSPDGNMDILYDFSDDKFSARAYVGTSYDGTVHTIRIDLRGAK